MLPRKKVHKEMVAHARSLGINILFAYCDLKKDPLILARAKHKLGQLIIEYVDEHKHPWGGFIVLSLPKRYETPDAKEQEIEPVYISFGFHSTATELFETFLSDCEELVKLFSLEDTGDESDSNKADD